MRPVNALGPAAPLRHDIVLVGGGHTHVQVLTAFAMRPMPGVRLTLVTDRLTTPYSGMLPGHVAGVYSADEMHIDLARLARATGTRLIHAAANGLDCAGRQVLLVDRPPLSYDALSLNVGITPDLSAVSGASEHGIAVKPISSFLARLDSLLEAARRPDGPRRIAIVGGGAAGVELAHALRPRLNREAANHGLDDAGFSLTLISSSALVPTLNAGVRQRVTASLVAAGIDIRTGLRVAQIERDRIVCTDGIALQADAVLLATDARAANWLSATGLPLASDGSVRIGADLRVVDHENLFAVGDCAVSSDDPRPKAGVFAVRQGPVLAANLRRHLLGQPLTAYRAQRNFLTLLLSGDSTAIAGRGQFLSTEGQWVWRWKDWIDRRFMAMFAGFGADMARPPREDELEAGTAMRCGGCAAKIGPAPLARALHRLPPMPPASDTILVGLDAPDDAAVVEVAPGVAQIETIDQIRAFIPDGYLFGRIAALHALNDVLAMGGVPTRALAVAGVPYGSADKVEADLFQLLAGARRELDAQGIALIGGHSSESEQLTLGFAVTGQITPAAIRRKNAARPGDVLILTKALGTGIIMAADMRGAAPARTSAAALAAMLLSNARASALAAPVASAMTDVTGFGLAGHLVEMLRDTGLAARIDLAALPLLTGASALARAGYRSSLTTQNLVLATAIAAPTPPDAATLALLFDPQTSGPLLIAVAPHAAAVLIEQLHQAGYAAAAAIGYLEPAGAAGSVIRTSGAVQAEE